MKVIVPGMATRTFYRDSISVGATAGDMLEKVLGGPLPPESEAAIAVDGRRATRNTPVTPESNVSLRSRSDLG